jgi:hypothetical protein
MEERRRSRRLELNTSLSLKNLSNAQGTTADVEVTDVSKSGIGFVSSVKLEIGSIHEAELTIWTKEKIHTFLEIVRIEKKDDSDQVYYGAYFVGMPLTDVSRIGVYDEFQKAEGK